MKSRKIDEKSYPIPNIELIISVRHNGVDMSAAVERINTASFPYNELEGKSAIPTDLPDVGPVDIVSLTPEHIEVKWNGETFSVDLGDRASSKEYPIDDADQSHERIRVTVQYIDFSDYNGTLDLIDSITITPGFETPSVTQKKKMALFYLGNLIEQGYNELYVLNALLVSSDDWDGCEVVRKKAFRKILKEGMEMDCLAPDNEFAWSLMELAFSNNDPETLLSGRVLKEIRELASAAAEADNQYAKTVLTII